MPVVVADYFCSPDQARERARYLAAQLEMLIARGNWEAAAAVFERARAEALSREAVTTVAELNLPAKLLDALDRNGVIYLRSIKGRSQRALTQLPGIGPGWANRVFTAVRDSAAVGNSAPKR